jgi:outer membrane immunogenic protein
MNRITALGVIWSAFALAGQAIAADLPTIIRAPVPYPSIPEPVFSWTGFYIGGNIGYVLSTEQINAFPTSLSASLNPQGLFVGGQVGGNYQIGNFVVGAEFDGDWSSITNNSAIFAIGAGLSPVQATASSRWEMAVAGRFGAAVDCWFFYGKAGWGWVENTATINIVNGGGTVWTGSNTNNGWLIGGGIEFAIDRNWSVKTEYDYIGLGNWTGTTNSAVLGPLSINVNPRGLNQFLVGFNYMLR